jgi:hypothetical protein
LVNGDALGDAHHPAATSPAIGRLHQVQTATGMNVPLVEIRGYKVTSAYFIAAWALSTVQQCPPSWFAMRVV